MGFTAVICPNRVPVKWVRVLGQALDLWPGDLFSQNFVLWNAWGHLSNLLSVDSKVLIDFLHGSHSTHPSLWVIEPLWWSNYAQWRLFENVDGDCLKMFYEDPHINSLWSSDTIWCQRSGSTLVQVMACCLTAPSHYLNQNWLIIREVNWHSY